MPCCGNPDDHFDHLVRGAVHDIAHVCGRLRVHLGQLNGDPTQARDFSAIEHLSHGRVHLLILHQALQVLKKKLQREGVFRQMKLKQHFEKPSEKKVRPQAEAIRRARKAARKRLEREGVM